MDVLVHAIRTTPIIDNHAHPLLIPSSEAKYPLLSITSEAHGTALSSTISSLSHIRAVKQLSQLLGCADNWSEVEKAILIQRLKSDNAWSKKCLEGIETILIDDGLDGRENVYDYGWHDRLVGSKCKRIVRVEKIAESISENIKLKGHKATIACEIFLQEYLRAIEEAVADADVVGFKSVICYRGGLDIPVAFDMEEVRKGFTEYYSQQDANNNTSTRISGSILNGFLVHTTASIIGSSKSSFKKPFQFHTGLGDNDITLTLSLPAYLQPFIKAHPSVPIVLLHASYPWTKEAGYLASVYDNVYADIGEVFPMVSREGQENVIREVLELCPTEKLLWSTDGHWFPETYLLAVIQVREALEKIFPEYVYAGDMSIPQAVNAVQDILFNTSNKIYNLELSLKATPPSTNSQDPSSLPRHTAGLTDLEVLKLHKEKYPDFKYLRLQYLDYTSTLRKMSVSITKASLALLQNDTFFPGAGLNASSGEYRLQADFTSLRAGPSIGYASVQCIFIEQNLSDVGYCPRSICQNSIKAAKDKGLEFLLGFEIEIVFLEYDDATGKHNSSSRLGGAHSWGSSRAFDTPLSQRLLDEIFDTLGHAGIDLEYFHPESAHGQYEFILPPLPPLQAIDTLIQARQIIVTVANKHSLRATLIPKPFPRQAGTASHVHISIVTPPSSVESTTVKQYESFYAGVLEHLPAILAFTYPQQASYERMCDSCWAGGTWVAWGTQNRETALRKIEGSHWEIKVLDGLANPYLAIAAFIAAGTQGVTDGIDLVQQDCRSDPAQLSVVERNDLGIRTALPETLRGSLEALSTDQILQTHLGVAFVARYRQLKSAESAFLEAMGDDERREWIIARY